MSAPAPITAPGPDTILTGTLHIYVAFDWGDEVDLERARQLLPAEVHDLPRRRRTPPSIAYRPPPLRFHLPAVPLGLCVGDNAPASAEATVFDFAAISVAFHVPFRLPLLQLQELAASLSDPAPLHTAARSAVEPLHARLLPAIRDPEWKPDLSEEYFVFRLPPGNPLSAGTPPDCTAWLAQLVRLESGRLSPEEVAEALRRHITYSPDDLFVPDWAAAALFDADPECAETLQVIEFANLQLLEYRAIDERLDVNLAGAYRLVHEANRKRLRFWRSYDQPLRVLGELKVEANDLFERTSNVLKLVGDQYLARLRPTGGTLPSARMGGEHSTQIGSGRGRLSGHLGSGECAPHRVFGVGRNRSDCAGNRVGDLSSWMRGKFLMDPLITNPFAVLTFIAAPAILTNASSVMALGTSNRFARAIDRREHWRPNWRIRERSPKRSSRCAYGNCAPSAAVC